MKPKTRLILMTLFTIGWVLPLFLSIDAWFEAQKPKTSFSFPHLEESQLLFRIAGLWFAAVIFHWTRFALSRRNAQLHGGTKGQSDA